MTWTAIDYDRRIVNIAGDYLARRRPPASGWPWAKDGWVTLGVELPIVNNWRAAHTGPLGTVVQTLDRKASEVSRSAVVSQRLKRLPSIQKKLERFPSMKLTQIQDIGGCRAVVPTVGQVRRLYRRYSEWPVWGSISHVDDYITSPKLDGYRGIHLVYKYQAHKPEWHGLKIEIQLRSRRMHAWATSVEIVDTLTEQRLKVGGGTEEWRRFFALMSSAIAQAEGTPRVGDTPRTKRAVISELRHYAELLDVRNRLDMFRSGLRVAETHQPGVVYWWVLTLDLESKTVNATGWPYRGFAAARRSYEEMEAEAKPGVNAVLVSVDQAKNLKRAYPNYFLDSAIFLDLLHDALAT